jgi:hypothetical protein
MTLLCSVGDINFGSRLMMLSLLSLAHNENLRKKAEDNHNIRLRQMEIDIYQL